MCKLQEQINASLRERFQEQFHDNVGKKKADIYKLSKDLTFIALTNEIQDFVSGKRTPPLFDERQDNSQTPLEFLKEVWGEYLKDGAFYQDQLSKIDPSLLSKLRWYLHNKGVPVSEIIPPKKDRIHHANEILFNYGLRAV